MCMNLICWKKKSVSEAILRIVTEMSRLSAITIFLVEHYDFFFSKKKKDYQKSMWHIILSYEPKQFY